MIKFAHYQSFHHEISLCLRPGRRWDCLHSDRLFLIPSISIHTLKNFAKSSLTKRSTIQNKTINLSKKEERTDYIYIYIFFKKLSLNPEIEYHCGYWWSLNLYLPYQSYTFAWDLRQVFKTIKISSELVVRIEFGHYSVGNSLQRR